MNGLIAYILSKKFTKGHFKDGTNITFTDNADGTVSINASGEVSSEDAYAREQIAAHIADDENPHSVTAEQIGAYVKNDDGIPYDDLSNSVQTSLGLADSALQSHQNISGKEDKTNKVTAWSDELSDARYPSEKLVKDSLDNKVDKIYGKGLSANDYTNADKTLVSTIEDKIDKEDIVSTYYSEGTSPVNGKAIADALDSLDVSSIGGVEKYIKSISEENGKVSAVTGTIDSVLVSNSQSSNLVTSNAIAAFVNSSIATNTANYISNNGQPFTSFEQLQAYSGTKTNNDYAFVKSIDASGNTIYIRYKYNDNDQSWGEEYVLNNSSFTEAQWTTISSGLSSLDKTKLDGIESGANKTTVDNSLSSSSTNPVQNKIVKSALNGLQAQLDNFVYEAQASGDVALEVAQARVDINGTNYDKLGDRINADENIIYHSYQPTKNLIALKNTTQTLKGVVATTNQFENVITLNGTAASSGGRNTVLSEDIELPAGDYTLQISSNSNVDIGAALTKTADGSLFRQAFNNTPLTFRVDEATTVYFGLNVTAGNNYNNIAYSVQLERSNSATDIVPHKVFADYVARTYIANIDDEISKNIDKKVFGINYDSSLVVDYQQGSSKSRAETTNLTIPERTKTVSVTIDNQTYQIAVKKNGVAISGWESESYTFVPEINSIYTVMFKKSDGTNFTDDDLANVTGKFNVSYTFPTFIDNFQETEIIKLTSDRTTPIICTKNTIIYGNNHKVDCGIRLNAEFSGGIAEVSYTVDTNSDIYKCFVSHSKSLEADTSRPYYYVTIWGVKSKVSECVILTPYLTTSEVQSNDNSFTYDGTKFIIHCDSEFDEIVMSNVTNCLQSNGYDVKCYDTNFYFADIPVNVQNCHYTFENCQFGFSRTLDTFEAWYASGRLSNCDAFLSNSDGFNFHYGNSSEVINCSGYYCQDDGISHHEAVGHFIIDGGEWHHNGKGGVASPASQSNGNVQNVYCHDNAYGIYAVNTGAIPDKATMFYNVVAKNNDTGILCKAYRILAYNCKFDNNTENVVTGNGGTVTTI